MKNSDFKDFLDAISICFIDKNFELWKQRIIFPFSLITSAGPVILGNEEQLRQNFELYLTACEAMQLDRIYRTPISLENCLDGSWIGTYETNLLSHGVRAAVPYTSSALMYQIDGIVCMRSIMNARGHHDWTGKQPKTYH